MRSEQEIMDLILDTARGDRRIRAVILNGSRANPNAPRDPFQDFDILYLVTDIAPFSHNLEWIKHFGELMILQIPEDMQDPPPDPNGRFTYLMQFTDGNRIDLGIVPLQNSAEVIEDSLTVVLLDKDQRFRAVPASKDSDYFPQTPTEKAFADCCNEFWWVCPYVAKGLWRGEIVYAKYCLEHYVREQLLKMVTWYASTRTGFSKNIGKNGKYLQQHLEPEIWTSLLSTYSDAGYGHTWEALFAACDLFRKTAVQVAEIFSFDYPNRDDQRVSAYLEHIQHLPADANEIFP
jgi:aminoglycoside 6-adenylyltransferase